MIKAEWGTKRSCPKCATRFYDLGNEDPVTCINCGHAWLPDPVLKSKQPLPYEQLKAGIPVASDKPVDTDADSDLDLDVDVDDDNVSPDNDVDLGDDDDLGVDTGDKNDDDT